MSSDESFLWTSASNSNSDSDDGNTSPNFSEMKIEMKKSIVKNEEDGKYKKVKNKVVNGNIDKKVSHNYCIKDELTSDQDIKIVKNEYGKSLNNTDNNDSYLNLRVKEEQLSCLDDLNIPVKKKKKNKKTKHSLELNNDDRFVDLETTLAEDVCNNEHEISIEETVGTRSNEDDEISAIEDSYSAKQKKKKKKHRSSSADMSVISGNYVSDQKQMEENNFESGNVNDLEPSISNLSKVSDRIQFEEDISHVDFNKSVVFNESTQANCDRKQIRRYLKKHSNLQPISSKTKLDSTITDTDDVWLVKCPQDVDILHLKDIPLSLNNKTKLKMGGKVYEYMVDNNSHRLPLLTFQDQNKSVIKILRTNGCILLKNKVPKVHIPDSEIMVNNQTNFIPLPDTKCRHPLFGIHYKKLIKVPVDIAKRLHTDQELNSLNDQDTIKRKKKKQKKNKSSLENNSEFQEQIKLEQEITNKKKKRKLSSGTNSPVKSKQMKYDPDSPPTWDSEKAIEENLFNF